MKFGASGNKALTWALNVYLPALVCEHYSRSRIVAFSMGNVYPFVNVTGPETISVHHVAQQIGSQLKRKVLFSGCESPTALLYNASRCFDLFGHPRVSLDEMLRVIVDWVVGGKHLLKKPTKYEVRDGKF